MPKDKLKKFTFKETKRVSKPQVVNFTGEDKDKLSEILDRCLLNAGLSYSKRKKLERELRKYIKMMLAQEYNRLMEKYGKKAD